MPERLGEAVLELRTDGKKLDKGIDRAEKKGANLAKAFKRQGLLIAAAVGAAVAAFTVQAIKAATDAAEVASKFDTVFGESRGTMNAWIRELQATVPATVTQLRSMAASLQDLLVPIGIMPSDAADMSQGFIELAADLASFNNVPIQQALNSLRSGIIGQSEPLTQFGIDVRATAVSVKALELGLIEEGEAVDNAARAQAVLAIAVEQSTFAIGDSARTAGEAANQFKFLGRDWEEISETVGTILLPIVRVVLSVMTDMAAQVRENSGNWTFLATILALPVKMFFEVQKAVQRLKINLLNTTLGILEMVEGVNDLLGTWSPFPRLSRKLTRAMDQIKLKQLQAKDSAKKWEKRQDDLNDVLKEFSRPAKEVKAKADAIVGSFNTATKATKKLADVAKIGNTVFKSTNSIIQKQIDKFNVYNPALTAAATKASTLNLILRDSLDITLASVAASADAAALATVGLASAQASAKNAAEALAGEGGVQKVEDALDALGESLEQNEEDLGSWASLWEKQVSTIVTDFSAGVADMIFEGKNLKDTMLGIFSEMGKAIVRTLIEDLIDRGLGVLRDFVSGIGGIFKPSGGPATGGGAPGGGGGGVIPTATFTELAITGVAIQTGIFATGVSITGVQIQTGNFNTGIAITGVSFGAIFGGGGTKETAFNTRLILGWIEGFFPITTGQLNTINTNLVTILTIIAERVRLSNFITTIAADRLFTLITLSEQSNALTQSLLDASANRIAPSVEGIQSRLEQTLNVNVANTINVNVKNVGEVGAAVGGSVSSQNRLLVAEIKRQIQTNQFGLRSEIAKVS